MNAIGDRPSSGLSRNSPRPTEITVHAASRVLGIVFDDGRSFRLPFEFLRVHSPSAEVQGHGPGQERLQVGKRDVTVVSVDSVGHYAVQLVFSDGHDTGLYSWDYLYELGIRQDELWADYLRRLEAAGASREPAAAPPGAAQGAGCAHQGMGPAGPGGGDGSAGWTSVRRGS